MFILALSTLFGRVGLGGTFDSGFSVVIFDGNGDQKMQTTMSPADHIGSNCHHNGNEYVIIGVSHCEHFALQPVAGGKTVWAPCFSVRVDADNS